MGCLARLFPIMLIIAFLLIVVFAYLWSQGFFVLNATPKGDVASADSFIVLGFGLGQEIIEGLPEPGKSNEMIAQRLLELNPPEENRRIAVVQRGIYTALLQYETADALDEWVIQLPHSKSAYADTHTAIYQAWALLETQGVSKPALLCQRAQSQRAYWMVNNIYPDIIIPDDLPETYGKNTQFLTQSRWTYAIKEYAVSPIGWVLRWY